MLEATQLDSLPQARHAALTGARQLGRYRVQRILGAGAMGVVYEAFDPELDRRVALKIVRTLTCEARAMARVDHPNVVAVYDVGTTDEASYIAMELVDGTTLADWLASAPRTPDEIVRAFVGAARGLAAAHDAGVIHRDFKPQNVLRSHAGRVLVGDFGIAIHGAAESPEWAGTPAYMAPEQRDGGHVGPWTDQYSFCIALQRALGDRDQIPAARFRSLLRRGLDPDIGKRWPDMHMVANLLESHLRSRKWIVVVAVGTFLALFGLGAVAGMSYRVGQETAPVPTLTGVIGELQAHDNTRVIIVRDPDYFAAAGLESGDIVVAIDGVPTPTKEAFGEVVRRIPSTARSLRIDVLRGGEPISIKLGEH